MNGLFGCRVTCTTCVDSASSLPPPPHALPVGADIRTHAVVPREGAGPGRLERDVSVDNLETGLTTAAAAGVAQSQIPGHVPVGRDMQHCLLPVMMPRFRYA